MQKEYKMFTTRTTAAINALLFVLLLSLFSCNSSAPKEAEIYFEQTVYDLGTTMKDSPVREITVTFENKGRTPLTIEDVKTDCPCTTTEFEKSPIKCGRKGEIHVKIDLTGFLPSDYSKQIKVFSNAANGDQIITFNTKMVY